MGIGKKRNDSLPPDLNFEMLNQYFSSSSSYVNNCKSRTLNHLHSLPTPDFPEFVLCQVADCDVKKNITAVTSNAIGNDNVSRNMILPLLDLLTPIITKIFNNSINTGTFPTLWKDAQIIPLPKKSNPKSFCDYRPISILPFLSKILERLVQQQLNLFLNQNNLLNTFQSGFRPGHSTVTALVKITDDIRAGMENRQVTILTLLDFSNAFNTVDFDILLAVLRSINVSPAATDWFRSYLFGRRQCIRIEDTYSSWCSLDAGVPQGGVLSPLLFSIFIRSITSGITSLYHLYADDLQIYSQTSINNLPSAVLSTNRDLAIISEFCTSYGIKVFIFSKSELFISCTYVTSQLSRPGRRRHWSACRAANCGITKTVSVYRRPGDVRKRSMIQSGESGRQAGERAEPPRPRRARAARRTTLGVRRRPRRSSHGGGVPHALAVPRAPQSRMWRSPRDSHCVRNLCSFISRRS
ncbi:unnamed protein product [Parnassius mnemosyne]|uniref:Reverse transcriptase domain-containing protein n=1 Tax=Parnassius mnemosyne TaxID=213953 RepID=A0AAV1KT55_9NEOP